MLWLSAYAFVAACVAVIAYPVRNLYWLTVCFAVNPLAMMLVPVQGAEYFLIVALADLIMALLCIVFWCWASKRVAQLSLLAMVLNGLIFIWYQNPLPYDAFLTVYGWRPHVIRAIELGQLLILIYYTPIAQRLAGRHPREEREPPCQFSTSHLH